jgi:ribosomal protein L12E/L44/L45/RPP1/RPP2
LEGCYQGRQGSQRAVAPDDDDDDDDDDEEEEEEEEVMCRRMFLGLFNDVLLTEHVIYH